MISLSAVSGSGAGYYADDNYYTRDAALDASAWMGAAADRLGLEGNVEEQAFAAILEGKLPNGAVIKAPNGEHRPGLDLTFSASKSLSLLAILGGDKRLIHAFQSSVKETLKWAEKNVAEARVWDHATGKQVPKKTGNLLAATFLHDVNRNGEPQLHIHGVIANAAFASDGKWHALRNDEIYKAQHVISAVHNADLRARVEKLGYETVPAKNPIDGAFEIKGVSREAVEAFSTRREEILAALNKEGRTSAKEREIAALSTRKAKGTSQDHSQRIEEWRSIARAVKFNPEPLIEVAHMRALSQQTIWERVTAGMRGFGERGMALVAAMGLTPKEKDPLVPERLGRLDPRSYAAAQAVASAARELGEYEAAYSRHDLIRTALERYGPFTVADIEARIDHLQAKGQLIGGETASRKSMLTTEQSLHLERRVISSAQEGLGKAEPIISSAGGKARLQEAAKELGLRRLNAGQENAGHDILTSNDRVHLVQGGAGVGKSAALAPVAAIARQEGRHVYALAHVGKIAREFGEKTNSPASTVDGFLGRYARVLDGSASPERMKEAREQLRGAVILVDEASQIGTDRLDRIVRLANVMEAGRLVLAGDIKQLPAIEAGKPFAELQKERLGLSHVTENLRAQTPQMQALNKALTHEDIRAAFAVLAPNTHQVNTGEVAKTAAQAWASLPREERETTLLLASGRAMRSAGNAEAQAALLAKGELGQKGVHLTVLDRVTISKEGARQLKAYREGRIAVFQTNLTSQGIAKGARGQVMEVKDSKVELLMQDGKRRQFDPSRLPYNLKHDAVTLMEEKPISLHEGDRIRWTAKDAERGLMNGDIAHVGKIGPDGLSVTTESGENHRLRAGDPMLERLDLAYALNVHVAQGMTCKNGIIMMSEQEKTLNSTRSFLVAVSRIAEKASLIIDDPNKVERQIAANKGEKTSASEVGGAKINQKSPQKELEITKSRELDLGL